MKLMMVKKYSGTIYYWKNDKLSTVYQSFLDAMDIIENSYTENKIKVKEKEKETEKILQVRKFAFGDDFRHNPPWN